MLVSLKRTTKLTATCSTIHLSTIEIDKAQWTITTDRGRWGGTLEVQSLNKKGPLYQTSHYAFGERKISKKHSTPPPATTTPPKPRIESDDDTKDIRDDSLKGNRSKESATGKSYPNKCVVYWDHSMRSERIEGCLGGKVSIDLDQNPTLIVAAVSSSHTGNWWCRIAVGGTRLREKMNWG